MDRQTISSKTLGVALSGTITVITVLCALAAALLPNYQATHNWLNLVATGEPGSFRNLVEAVINGVIFSWIAAIVFATLYNRFRGT